MKVTLTAGSNTGDRKYITPGVHLDTEELSTSTRYVIGVSIWTWRGQFGIRVYR